MSQYHSRNNRLFNFSRIIYIILMLNIVFEPTFGHVVTAQSNTSKKFPYTEAQLDNLSEKLNSLSFLTGFLSLATFEIPPLAAGLGGVSRITFLAAEVTTAVKIAIYSDPDPSFVDVAELITDTIFKRLKIPVLPTEKKIVQNIVKIALDQVFNNDTANVENPEPTAEKPPTPLLCENTPVSRLVIGQQGRLTPGPGANNLRDKPTKNGNKIGQIRGSDTFTVIEGPVCADGFAWWKVNLNGIVGWTPEGKDNNYYLEPFDSGHPLTENISTDIKEEIIGTWATRIGDVSAYITFYSDGTLVSDFSEAEINGTYTFVADNRILIRGKLCEPSPCTSKNYETEVAINGNTISIASPFDGIYYLWKRVK